MGAGEKRAGSPQTGQPPRWCPLDLLANVPRLLAAWSGPRSPSLLDKASCETERPLQVVGGGAPVSTAAIKGQTHTRDPLFQMKHEVSGAVHFRVRGSGHPLGGQAGLLGTEHVTVLSGPVHLPGLTCAAPAAQKASFCECWHQRSLI